MRREGRILMTLKARFSSQLWKRLYWSCSLLEMVCLIYCSSHVIPSKQVSEISTYISVRFPPTFQWDFRLHFREISAYSSVRFLPTVQWDFCLQFSEVSAYSSVRFLPTVQWDFAYDSVRFLPTVQWDFRQRFSYRSWSYEACDIMTTCMQNKSPPQRKWFICRAQIATFGSTVALGYFISWILKIQADLSGNSWLTMVSMLVCMVRKIVLRSSPMERQHATCISPA